MKNLIFVALLVSVMLVLSVGSAFALEGEVEDPARERQAATENRNGNDLDFTDEVDIRDYSGSETEAEVGGESGASGGAISSVESELLSVPLFPTIDEYNDLKDITVEFE